MIDEKKLSIVSEITTSLTKKKFILFLSYTAVGCANGRRCTFNGNGHLEKRKQSKEVTQSCNELSQSLSSNKKSSKIRFVIN